MSMDRAIKIKNLCSEYCKSFLRPDNIMVFDEAHKFELLNNSFQFHELEHDELLASIIGLSQTSMQKDRSVLLNGDHYHLWSWCGELLFHSNIQSRAAGDREHNQLYELVIRGTLARSNGSEFFENYHDYIQNRARIQNHFATYFVDESYLAVSYLVFPLLEGLLKRLSHAYISMDGKILQDFDIETPNGVTRYVAKRQKKGDKDKCSSVRDLLYLYQIHIASYEQNRLIDEFNTHLKTFDSSTSPNELIGKWRNESLHGTTSYESIGIAILNYCLLLSIGEGNNDYLQCREQATKKSRWEYGCNPLDRSRRSFYPPY